MKKSKILLFMIVLLIITTAAVSCSDNHSIESANPTADNGGYKDSYDVIRRTPPIIEKAEEVTPTADSFTVSKVFSDDMILQRDEYIRIWGWAKESENGKTICAEFMGLKGSAVIENGEWLITLDGTLPASTAMGNNLRVYSASNEKIFKDIMVGDVYLVIGQSNAAQTVADHLSNAMGDPKYGPKFNRKDITAEENIRIIQNLSTDPTTKNANMAIAENLMHNRKWRNPKKIAMQTSALGYFFAKQMSQKTNNEIPIGIIECSNSGAVMASFMSAEAAEACKADKFDQASNRYICSSVIGTQTSRINYNQRINPFMKFTVTGMLWFQGESDATPELSAVYANNFKTMIEDYRKKINQNYYDFPVFIVELPTEYRKPSDHKGDWHFIDTAKVRVQMGLIPSILKNSYIAVSGDVWTNKNFFNSLHSYCKWDIAARIADMCIPIFYDTEAKIDYLAGPSLSKYETKSKKEVKLYFYYVGDGLKTIDGKAPIGIEVLCGSEWVVPDNISIDNDCITVKHTSDFDAVRHYGITEQVFEETLNICSSSNLPLAAFQVSTKK